MNINIDYETNPLYITEDVTKVFDNNLSLIEKKIHSGYLVCGRGCDGWYSNTAFGGDSLSYLLLNYESIVFNKEYVNFIPWFHSHKNESGDNFDNFLENIKKKFDSLILMKPLNQGIRPYYYVFDNDELIEEPIGLIQQAAMDGKALYHIKKLIKSKKNSLQKIITPSITLQ